LPVDWKDPSVVAELALAYDRLDGKYRWIMLLPLLNRWVWVVDPICRWTVFPDENV